MHICNSCRCRRGGFQSEIIKGIVASRHIFTPSFFLLLGNLTNLVTFFTDYSARVHWWRAQCAKSFSSVSLRPGCQTQEVSFLSGRVRLSCVIDARKSNSVYVGAIYKGESQTKCHSRRGVDHNTEELKTAFFWDILSESEFCYSSDAGAEQVAIEPDTNQAFRFVTGSGSMQVLHSDTDTGSGKIILIQIQVPAK